MLEKLPLREQLSCRAQPDCLLIVYLTCVSVHKCLILHRGHRYLSTFDCLAGLLIVCQCIRTDLPHRFDKLRGARPP